MMEAVSEKISIEKYPSYKESGVEWLGAIPEHWSLIRLGIIGSFYSSGIDKKSVKHESEVKIINYTDVYGNERNILDSTIDFMVVTTPESNRVRNLVKKGDLVFLPSSETYQDLGIAALINEELENTSFSYHVLRFVFNKKIDHSFKKYFTNNFYVLNQFSREGRGTTRKILNRSAFKNITVAIPPLEEQADIAYFLDRKTIQIDRAIAQKEKLIELLKERRQILIHKVVTQGLDEHVKMKDSGVEWIRDIPEHWQILSNRSLFEERNESGNSELPILSVSIHTAVSDEEIGDDENIRGRIRIADKEKYKLVKPNDIAFNMMRAWQGAIGAVRVNGMVSPAYIVAKPKGELNSEYFEFLYRTVPFIQQIDRSSKGITDFRKRLYWSEFKHLLTVLPPVNEQNEIVDFIKKVTTKTDAAIEIKQREIEKLKEYKTALINVAVTGKIKLNSLNYSNNLDEN